MQAYAGTSKDRGNRMRCSGEEDYTPKRGQMCRS